DQYGVTAGYIAGSTSGYESESNDTRSSADEITFDSEMKGQLSSSRDVDYYKVVVGDSGILSVALDVPTNDSYSWRDYFAIGFYDSEGTLLNLAETGKDKTYSLRLQEAGSYYLKLFNDSSYYYSNDQYSLTASYTAGLPEYELEPNDEYANVLLSGTIVKGKLSTPTDIDWFYLKTSTTGSLSIDFDAPSHSSLSDSFYTWIFDEEGNVLASRVTGQDFSYIVNTPSAGRYFIAITSADDYDSGQYGLTVTAVQSDLLYESESNDRNAEADTLELGTTIHGQLSSHLDDDRYVVTFTSSGDLNIDFDGPTHSSWANYYQINVYDADNILLASRETGSDTSLDVSIPTMGDYYISVIADDYYSDEEYQLTVTELVDSPIPAGAIVGTVFNDRITGTENNDLIYGLGGSDLIDGGAGEDTVVFRAQSNSLSINTIEGLTTIRGDYSAGEHAYTVSRVWNIEKIQTSNSTETLTPITVTPILGSYEGEVVNGTAGNDLIDGLGGSDFIDAGEGTDTIVLFGAEASFTLHTVAGITRIQGDESTQEYAGHSIKVINTEIVAFNQSKSRSLLTNATHKIFGTSASDILTGSSADDIFDGQGGNDQIDGGSGEDTIVFFSSLNDFDITFPSLEDERLSITGKSGTEYAGQTVTVSNVESIAFIGRTLSVFNPPKVVLTPSRMLLVEGGDGARLDVSLSTAPVSTITLALEGHDQLSLSQSQLSFAKTNWNVPQSVIVTAIDDNSFEQGHSATLTVAITESDNLYKNVTPVDLTYSISDNDTPTTGSISGVFWNDSDKDGVIDSFESSLAGWTVFDDVNTNGKLDSGEAKTTSDISGSYRLDDLAVGEHTIVAQTELGWMPTYPTASHASASIIADIDLS
ncbi:MAG: hypothetical protein HOI33_11550, partial [Rhodospirillaceae bacterium]|nr:hypothetical protein [Rhodospirillaceae bacterium]